MDLTKEIIQQQGNKAAAFVVDIATQVHDAHPSDALLALINKAKQQGTQSAPLITELLSIMNEYYSEQEIESILVIAIQQGNQSGTVMPDIKEIIDSEPNYLRFTAINTASNIMLCQDDYLEAFYPNIEISNDKKNWRPLNFTVGEDGVFSDIIDLNAGETVYMRGNNPTGMRIYIPSVEDYADYYFIINGETSAGGDVNTLINKIGGDIPLYENCYKGLFSGCAELTSPPILPSTILAAGCYSSMFSYCTALALAPALPATTLVENCYNSMFHRCTALTSAPALPATILAAGCYNGMFSYCTSLSSVEVSATTWNTLWAYDWLLDVSASGIFRKPSGTTIPTGTSGIPSEWTVINI